MIDNSNMTPEEPEEASLQYTKCIADWTQIEQNLAIFSNKELTKLMNQSNAIHAASAKQYATNLENQNKLNQDILDASLKLDEVMKLISEKHSIYDKVTLDVGGRTFSTFKETLMRFEGSYFYGMLNSGQFLPGPDGTYFIDRSPAHFEMIMDYLRKGEFTKLELNDVQIYELRNEFDYYLLPIPQELEFKMKWDLSPSKKPVYATFSDDNLKITKSSGEAYWNCPVIGSSPVSEFTVQIISGTSIIIGFCPIDNFKQKGTIYNLPKVCCFYSKNGDVWYNGVEHTYSSKLLANDKLTSIKNGTSIRFLKNGVDLGEAINNAEAEMYTFVELGDVGSSVMIVPNP
jgi:hypothetical protein